MGMLARRALVVDDEPDFLAVLHQTLHSLGYDVVSALGLNQAIREFHEQRPDIVLSDLRLGSHDGLALCSSARELAPDVPIVVMTAFGDLDRAVDAMRAGASDFLTKPLDLNALEEALSRALLRSDLERGIRRAATRYSEAAAECREPAGMIGSSLAMRGVYDVIDRVASTDVNVLISGETGTGKELVARAIHERGGKASEPFVALNCAAVPLQLLESELFGHEKGAFTGARSRRDGLLVAAGSGTLFLDEVGEMPPEVQPKLLRVLEERRVRPVGGAHEVDVRCRVLAATNRDLEAEVKAGRFREDLFYRLDVVHIHVPPLRAREQDVLPLAQHFLERAVTRTGRQVAGFDAEAEAQLLAHDWPGNVRELANTVAHAVALARRDQVSVADLPERLRAARPAPALPDPPAEGDDDVDVQLPTLAELEAQHVRRVMHVTEGNKAAAARILGIDRRTLYRRLARLSTS